ncbi:MAG TPA: hypothetical protein VFC70_00065 [Oscillospiraceae bacterium]|nr:hypothetical protein [Oscillospiraceae bacterium]
MIQMLIDVAFLVLVLIPISILFIALYQNLIETLGLKRNTKRGKAGTQPYYTESKEVLPTRLRVIK